MIDQDGNYVDTSAYQYGGDGQYATVQGYEAPAAGAEPSWWSGFDFGDTAVAQAVNLALGGGPIGSERGAQYNAPAAPAAPAGQDAPADEGLLSRIQRMGTDALGSVKDGTSAAWKKDPMKVLEFLGGAVGGAYLSDEKRKAAQALAQSSIDQQNNKAAIDQAKVDAYNASFRTGKKRAPIKQTPLTRIDGTPVYTNGKLNRG